MPIAVTVVLLGCLSTTTVADNPIKIMPLGNSITEGIGSTNNNGYRKPLYLNLTNSSYDVNFVGSQSDGDFEDTDHEGHNGWHADGGPGGGLLPKIYDWLVDNPAEIVLLHIGTNDITSGDQDVNEVNDILDEIDRYEVDSNEPITVILALIINRQTYNAATTQYNNELNTMALNRIAGGDDIIIVDMENALNYSTDMADSVHPNDSGYAKMANVWYETLNNYFSVTITSTPITNAFVGMLYNYDVDANGIPVPTYSLTTSPTGMTIDYNTGLIEWTPDVNQVGLNAVTVEAANSKYIDTQTFDINVAELALPVITSIPDITVITATVNETYSYDVEATGIPAPTYALTVSPTGMTIDHNTGLIEWIPTEEQLGLNPVTIEAINSEGTDTQSFDIDVAGVPAAITSTPVITAAINQPYSYDVDANGIPIPTYSLTTAPTGMTIDYNTGLIEWTPEVNQVGLNPVTVWATNSEGSAIQSFDIDVDTSVAPVITSTPVITAAINQPYTYDVNATGIPAPTYALTVLPAGMTINTTTGVIDWTPTEAQLGLNAVTVEATNSEGSDIQSFDIDVAGGVAPVITSIPDISVITATVNQPYTYDVNATGIPAPTYALTTSPAGMTINATTGVIDWTPTEAQLGLNAVTVEAINSEGTDIQSYDIDVAGVPPAITSIPVITATVNQPYTYDVNATGDPVPTYSLTMAPTGMTIDHNTGLIEWTPDVNQVGSNAVTVEAINIEGNYPQNFNINVAEVLPSDDFNDNSRGATWRLFVEDYNNAWVVEDVNRLNMRAIGNVNNVAAFYVDNGWSFDVNENFEVEVDFHYTNISQRDGWIGITIEDDDTYVSISAGSDSNKSYFYYEAGVDSNTLFEQELRDSNDGTLYISFDANSNNLYLSHIGYEDANAYDWQTMPEPLQGQWTSPVNVAIGGGSDRVSIGPGEVYLDNFKTTTTSLPGWPPITDIDKDGLVDWRDVAIISENWLQTGSSVPGNIHRDGANIVNFLDFAEFALAW